MSVYFDKIQIVDGQRFDVNFAKGLSNSTVFVPIMSANCLKSFVELGRAYKEDFVLMEWIMACPGHPGAFKRPWRFPQ